MISLLGGIHEKPQFQFFIYLFVKSFIAIRAHYLEFLAMVNLIKNTNLTCFTENTLANLQNRFALKVFPSEFYSFCENLIQDSEGAITTTLYDSFQSQTNKIYY
jgi:phosphatidylinositol 4-kinase